MAAAFYPMTIVDGGGIDRNVRYYDSTIGDGTGVLHPAPLLLQTPTQIVDSTHGLYCQIVAGAEVIGQVYGAAKTVTTTITRPADTTAYTVNDAFADTTPTAGGFTISNAARASGGSGIIRDIFVVSSNVASQLQGELHIFDSATTAIADNAAWALSDADALLRLAVIPFTLVADVSNSYVHLTNLNIGFTCVGTANLRFLVKVKNAHAPESSETLTFRVKIEQLN